MKKVFVILIALAATMVACNKVADVNDPMDSVKEIVFNMEVKQGDVQDTKAVKTGWENGDKVYVFFKELVGTNKYATFTYDGSSWTKNANGIVASDLSGLADKQLTAVYFPFGTPTFTANGDKYDVTADESYYLCVNTTYTSAVVDESLVLSATLNMTVPAGFVQFSMPKTDGTNTFFRETPVYTLTESNLAPVSVTDIIPGSAPTQAVGSDGDPLTGYFYGDGGDRCILFSGILKVEARGNAKTDYRFRFVNNMESVATYDDVTYLFDVDDVALYRDGGASWCALKFPVISSPRWTVEEPGYVIVGGYKWAKWNVGATTETGYGDYFSWGAIYPQYKYAASDYQESAIAADLTDAKDVANQKLGENWHMPNKEQMQALRSKISSSTWRENYLGTGVTGLLITADNGTDVLFLPAAGCWRDVLSDAGSLGSYRSSTYLNAYFAWGLRIEDLSASVYKYSRDFGVSVRPVHD